ncbi:PREDICTED: 21 kDa protein-like [Tarenaya hassleriana]|uniref:21 kDa protein-like n=1 Tax=Tarenaya hassleriana TaxID=28532 RepID=UPI00053C1D9F|nr:PREDICTED: 21 kDa protein-like [Tarenaya hassleriana]
MKILSQNPIFSASLLLLLLQVSNASAADQTSDSNQTIMNSNQTNLDYIKTSCNATLYQTLCYSCLYPYASLIDSDPEKLAITALNLTLSETKSTQRLVKFISRRRHASLGPGEAAAVKDCLEEMSDSVYELKDSIAEMKAINYSSFEMVVSDVQTWVSAALTDQVTCMDGFEEAGGGKTEVKELVRKHIDRVTRMTSNALAFINLYASTVLQN